MINVNDQSRIWYVPSRIWNTPGMPGMFWSTPPTEPFNAPLIRFSTNAVCYSCLVPVITSDTEETAHREDFLSSCGEIQLHEHVPKGVPLWSWAWLIKPRKEKKRSKHAAGASSGFSWALNKPCEDFSICASLFPTALEIGHIFSWYFLNKNNCSRWQGH